MKARFVEFGVVEIDGRRYERDVVIDGGVIGKRKKKASRPLRDAYGHTPLSLLEPIPWDRPRLIIGTGADGALPIADEVQAEAAARGVQLIIVPTAEACDLVSAADPETTAAILHVTC